VQRNVDVIAQWVRFVVAKTGLPAIFFIDEAHMTSDKNAWGQRPKAGYTAHWYVST
jgi:hypothetical protein